MSGAAGELRAGWLDRLAARRRFGMKPGLDSILALCRALGSPQCAFPAIHVAGTDGKGAVCAMLDAALRRHGFRTGRYTSPHLVRIAERFFVDGAPAPDALLADLAARVEAAAGVCAGDITFFEALTAVAFLLYAQTRPDVAILETGLGGRLDATNVCNSVLCVIARIGLDHCDWLGDTVEKIAAEKAGIIKKGVPVVLGRNDASVKEIVMKAASAAGAPFYYAPDLASEEDIPPRFPLGGVFNRENAVTAAAALKVHLGERAAGKAIEGLADAVWPGRFQRVGRFIVDGAHNPPAAAALAASLREAAPHGTWDLVAGFCGDKDVDATLAVLAPFVRRAFAVETSNPRSVNPAVLAGRMASAGMDARACSSLGEALETSRGDTLICGSLFLAGEALVALGAYPWPRGGKAVDPAELLSPPKPE